MEDVIFKSFDQLSFKSNCFYIIDCKVYKLYKGLVDKVNKIYLFNATEDNKSLKEIENILIKLSENNCNRNTIIISLGGGITGDISGFAAAIYMRGVKWINCPTSLLSMCDSCIGGKTAVNLGNIKNLAGVFYRPEKIYIDTEFLNTLDNDGWLSGIGEIVKTSLNDSGFFYEIKNNTDDLISHNADLIKKVIKKCVAIKKSITQKDYFDLQLRKVLNAGHTIGHAYEALENSRSHGEYVLWGLLAELYIFRNYIDKDYYQDIVGIIKKILLGKSRPHFKADDIVYKALRDKKNKDKNITFSVPVSPGKINTYSITSKILNQKLLDYENFTN